MAEKPAFLKNTPSSPGGRPDNPFAPRPGQQSVRGTGASKDSVPAGGRSPLRSFDRDSAADVDSIRSPRKSFKITNGGTSDPRVTRGTSNDATSPIEEEEGADDGMVGTVPGRDAG